MHLPDLEAGCGDESFPPEEVSFEVLGRANGLKGLRSPTKQPVHTCALLGDPCTFSQSLSKVQAFGVFSGADCILQVCTKTVTHYLTDKTAMTLPMTVAVDGQRLER